MARSDRVVRLFVGVGVLAVLTRWLDPGVIWLIALVWLAGEWVHAWVRGGWELDRWQVGGAVFILVLAVMRFALSSQSRQYTCLSCGSRQTDTEWYLGAPDSTPISLGRDPSHRVASGAARELFPPEHAHAWSRAPRDPSSLARALDTEPDLRAAARRRMGRGRMTLDDLADLLLVFRNDQRRRDDTEKRARALLAELRREAAAGRSP